MKQKLLFAGSAILAALLLCAGIYWVKGQKERVRIDQCLSTLRSTGCTIKMYRNDYNGELPPNLSLMKDLISDKAFICPWDHKTPEEWSNITEWMDYVYLPWPSVKGKYANYPLMYDRHMANHNGKGICILLVDGAVRPTAPPHPKTYHGQFFWDEDAQWLQKFAREHPECNIPLPKNLNK